MRLGVPRGRQVGLALAALRAGRLDGTIGSVKAERDLVARRLGKGGRV
jgi:hypothetical protein